MQETHKHLGSDLEEKGRLKEAEEQYMQAGEWKSAINMYRAAEHWEDAYRIAKSDGGDAAQKQIAYLWAKSLGGDSAVKLLNKFNLLDDAIDYACDNGYMSLNTSFISLFLKSIRFRIRIESSRFEIKNAICSSQICTAIRRRWTVSAS